MYEFVVCMVIFAGECLHAHVEVRHWPRSLLQSLAAVLSDLNPQLPDTASITPACFNHGGIPCSLTMIILNNKLFGILAFSLIVNFNSFTNQISAFFFKLKTESKTFIIVTIAWICALCVWSHMYRDVQLAARGCLWSWFSLSIFTWFLRLNSLRPSSLCRKYFYRLVILLALVANFVLEIPIMFL